LTFSYDALSVSQHYWPGLYASLTKHLDNCLQCKLGSHKPPRNPPLQHSPVTGVLECLTVDHIAMPKAVVSTTGQQVQYCLTLVDPASQ